MGKDQAQAATAVDAPKIDALGDTVAHPLAAAPGSAAETTLRSTGRSAVLPRSANGKLVHEARERYSAKRTLGAGGMGEVVLAADSDIGRDVAVKYLLAKNDQGSLARFVDEIRIVGSLEHPNIVPIHDVGVTDDSRYFFVMKHVEGETLEHIIERLAAGDPAYHARFTFTARIELFLALLRGLAFAHARGYVHRDIKPANVMVGQYGEVVLMDWGIAKRCGAPAEARSAKTIEDEDAAADPTTARDRLYTTRRGALVGTPAYMSPEQARAEVDIDARSDVYSACALFYELVSLRHYLPGSHTTLSSLLVAIASDTPGFTFHDTSHPMQGPPPAELLHFLAKGLRKDPAERYESAREMIDVLEAALDGRVKVQCAITFTKRTTRELGRFVDRRPIAALYLFLGTVVAFVAMAAFSIAMALRAM
jgi:serine/threonine-protein kinase